MSRPVKFFPAFTKHPANYPPMKESYCATCLVRPRVFEVTSECSRGQTFQFEVQFFSFNVGHFACQTPSQRLTVFDKQDALQ